MEMSATSWTESEQVRKHAPHVGLRRVVLLTHRYAGLALALFLILLGITGSLLAFNTELERSISPQLFAMPRSGATPLSLATLAERAERLVPEARLDYLILRPDQVMARMEARETAAGQVLSIDFDQVFLDPVTGQELGRRRYGDLTQGSINLMPFIYVLHRELALGQTGMWILGAVSLVWTIDCITAFYLTLPLTFTAFWRRWRQSWLVKWPASAFRFNFDLHRAGALWVWPILLVFGWSGVMMDLTPVYDRVTGAVFDYRPLTNEIGSLPLHSDTPPRMKWHEAESLGARLMAEEASRRGFTLGQPDTLAYIRYLGVYSYGIHTDLDIRQRSSDAAIWFDGDTGAVRAVFLPTGNRTGNTITTWLWALHFGDLRNATLYRILVCLIGLVVAMLSATGIYIWLKKRRARRTSRPYLAKPNVRSG
jgi:uncharacterized iron-regulated membrane protein